MAPQRFLIAAFPRTGSNWLCGALDSHPDVVCHYEALHPTGVHLSHRVAVPPTPAERDRDVAAFVEGLYEQSHGCRAVGFKAMFGQQMPLLEQLLHAPEVAKIVLRRRNRVRVLVSANRATVTGAFAGGRYDSIRLQLDPQELFRFAHVYDRYYAWVDRCVAGQSVLRPDYEELFAPGRLASVLAFLGVAADESLVEPVHARQSSDSLRHALANFDELAAALAGTDLLADLLEDDVSAAA